MPAQTHSLLINTGISFISTIFRWGNLLPGETETNWRLWILCCFMYLRTYYSISAQSHDLFSGQVLKLSLNTEVQSGSNKWKCLCDCWHTVVFNIQRKVFAVRTCWISLGCYCTVGGTLTVKFRKCKWEDNTACVTDPLLVCMYNQRMSSLLAVCLPVSCSWSDGFLIDGYKKKKKVWGLFQVITQRDVALSMAPAHLLFTYTEEAVNNLR